MSKQFRRSGKKAGSLFGLGALVIALAVLHPVQAEEILQAQALKPTIQDADALKGVTLAQLPAKAAPLVAAADDDEDIDLLSETNVTAQRRRTTERENTQTTFVINKDDIKTSGATTVNDALRLVPSANFVDALGGLDLTGFNQIRGLDDQRFVLLQDGRPLTRASNNKAANISKLGVTNVERIEVVTGGGTLRYGADAIAGVVNIITKAPEGPPKVTASVNFGSYGYSQYTLDYSGSNGLPSTTQGYFAFDLAYERRSVINDFLQTVNVSAPGNVTIEDGLGNSTTVDSFNNTREAYGYTVYSDSYFAKAIFKPGKDHTITISAQQQNTRRGYAFYYGTGCYFRPNGFTIGGVKSTSDAYECRGGKFPENYFQYLSDIYDYHGAVDLKIDQTAIDLTWDWNLSELNSLTTQISFDDSWENYPFSTGQRYLNNRTLDAQVRYTAEPYPGNTLNTGFEFLSNNSIQVPFIGAPTGEPLPPGSPFASDGRIPIWKEISRWALYFTEDLKFFDDALIVNLGSRLTDDIQFGTFTTSGLGFRYNFGGEKGKETFGLRANWQQTYKAPGITQLYATQISVRPNPDLTPETGVGYDIGLDVSLSPTALLRATYYRIDLTNIILDRVQVSDTSPKLTTVNAQAFLSTGWELSFDWKFAPKWEVIANQSFTDARGIGNADADPSASFGSPVAGGFFYGYQNVNTPYHTTGVQVRYKDGDFNLALLGRIIGERPIAGTKFSPAYSVWDITTNIPLTKNLTLNGGLFNIFDSRYELYTRYIGYTSVGTNFQVGLQATF